MTLYTTDRKDIVQLVSIPFVTLFVILTWNTMEPVIVQELNVKPTLASYLVYGTAGLLTLTTLYKLYSLVSFELAVRRAIGKYVEVMMTNGNLIRGKLERADGPIKGEEVKIHTVFGSTHTGKGYGRPPSYFLQIITPEGNKWLINTRMIRKIAIIGN